MPTLEAATRGPIEKTCGDDDPVRSRPSIKPRQKPAVNPSCRPHQLDAQTYEWIDEEGDRHGRFTFRPACEPPVTSRRILSLFDVSGAWSRPYREAGYQVAHIDLQNWHTPGDVMEISPAWFDDYDLRDRLGSAGGAAVYRVGCQRCPLVCPEGYRWPDSRQPPSDPPDSGHHRVPSGRPGGCWRTRLGG